LTLGLASTASENLHDRFPQLTKEADERFSVQAQRAAAASSKAGMLERAD
jgi:hypothetical protein